MTDGVWERAREVRDASEGGRPLYERIANVLADAIRTGDLPAGHRLPTVRDLADQLQVSVTTVVNSYNRLRTDGLIAGEVGRGTFVSSKENAAARPENGDPDRSATLRPATTHQRDLSTIAWRRGALALAESRLRAAFPVAVDLMRGGPDPMMLPTEALRRAWRTAADALTVADLQYPMRLEPDPALAERLLPRLRADGIGASADELLIASSTQQILSLVAELLREESNGDDELLAAVEEPGYQTAMDTFERGGLGLVGVAMDQAGARPEALDQALAAGARLVLLTPRAQSPTGVSWTAERRAELGEVLAAYPRVWIVEDDHFAEAASSRPGSLVSDPRLRDRVIYVRSFSKSLAPDLRLAAVVAGDELRNRLALAKSYADGWSPRSAQRALAALLADPETDQTLALARDTYAHRRATLGKQIQEQTDGAISVTAGADGLHLWLALPPRCGASELVVETASAGFLLATSEPFYLRPGQDRFIRLNAGVADLAVTTAVAETLAKAVRQVSLGTRVVLTL